MWCAIATEEELATAADCSLNQCFSVARPLGNRFAVSGQFNSAFGGKSSGGDVPVAEWIVCPIIDYEIQMMRSDRSNNVGTTRIDSFNSFTGRAMLQDDFELWRLRSVLPA